MAAAKRDGEVGDAVKEREKVAATVGVLEAAVVGAVQGGALGGLMGTLASDSGSQAAARGEANPLAESAAASYALAAASAESQLPPLPPTPPHRHRSRSAARSAPMATAFCERRAGSSSLSPPRSRSRRVEGKTKGGAISSRPRRSRDGSRTTTAALGGWGGEQGGSRDGMGKGGEREERGGGTHTRWPAVLAGQLWLRTADAVEDTITASRPLSGNQKLVSRGEKFALGFFRSAGGHLKKWYIAIWYNKVSIQTAVWIANREAPISNLDESQLAISQDGTLVLLNQSRSVVWSSNVPNVTSSNVDSSEAKTVAVLLNTGNLALPYLTDGKYDPSTGAFSGIPEMTPIRNSIYAFQYVDNNEEAYFMVTVKNDNILFRLTIDVSSQAKSTVWVADRNQWMLFFLQPKEKLAASELPDSKTKKWRVVSIIIGGFILLVCGVITCICFLRKRTMKAIIPIAVDGHLTTLKYSDLQLITKSFSEKLGSGSFGSVFKGALPDKTVVAVKKLEGFRQGEKQVRAEMSTIRTIHHINLVRLLGFCSHGAQRLLVCEHMQNGSLDRHLFVNNAGALSWSRRYQIAIGISKGLPYLHERCRDCIIHCDIKPDNILLDASFVPKVADFGLAKLLGRDFSRVLTSMRGTIGYLAPEWISGMAITSKADVFSYGMLLFEIISQRRNAEQGEQGANMFFPVLAAKKLLEDDVQTLLDPESVDVIDLEELGRACKVACWCVQDEESSRPSMGEIVQILEGFVDVSIPPVPRYLHVLAERANHDSN
uniref:non-specific serine/threonine protein kinase n=1 Tax=Oryza rufipogon TaxID=4529 RepID=A0A0E0PMJ7_ORYRU